MLILMQSDTVSFHQNSPPINYILPLWLLSADGTHPCRVTTAVAEHHANLLFIITKSFLQAEINRRLFFMQIKHRQVL